MADRDPLLGSVQAEQNEYRSRTSSRSPFVMVEKQSSLEREAELPEKVCSLYRFYAIKALQFVFRLLLFALLLLFLVASKVSFVTMATTYNFTTSVDEKSLLPKEAVSAAVESNFWRLLLVIIVPYLFGFLRCLKSCCKNYPWPSLRAIGKGLLATGFESAAITAFVFFITPKIPNGALILCLCCGVFTFTIIYHLVFVLGLCGRSERCDEQPPSGIGDSSKSISAPSCCFCFRLLEVCFSCIQSFFTPFTRCLDSVVRSRKARIFFTFLALLMEIAAITLFLIDLDVYEKSFSNLPNVAVIVVIPVVLLVLSIVWASPVQESINDESTKELRLNRRTKAGIITNFFRLFFTVVFSLIWAKVEGRVDFDKLGDGLKYMGRDQVYNVPFLVNIFTTLGAYLVAWLSCTVKMHKAGFFWPLVFATPVSVIIVLIPCFASSFFLLPYIYVPACSDSGDKHALTILSVVLLWLAQLLCCLFYVYRTRLAPLMQESHIFIQPLYNGPFIEQYLMLNRRTEVDDEKFYASDPCLKARNKRVFICTPMYHETVEEMMSILGSIKDIANNHSKNLEDLNYRREFEFHICFDDGAQNDLATKFPLQLITLLEKLFNVKLKDRKQLLTPYGIQLSWKIVGDVPIYVHLKDPTKVKKKKRWSQVMYMKYILDYRREQLVNNAGEDVAEAKRKAFDQDTYILATDGDVEFTYDAVDVLIDRLARDLRVGAVCGRTHTLGSGPLVWYQTFDYLVGHWFQKAAEHVLGSVLCCPGCFTLYRVGALRDVIDNYSSTAVTGAEFLKKDMGEDRWLSTLLNYAGWRLEYAAAADCYTHCPTTFEEFWKQRRRWVPSTLANLYEFCSNGCEVISKNDSVGVLYLLYQFIMLFSTIINPGTVILIMAAGLQYGLAPQENLSIFYAALILTIAVTVFFGFVCVYCSEETKFDVARVLTFIYALIMTAVIIGVIVQVVVSLEQPQLPTEAPYRIMPPGVPMSIIGPAEPNGLVTLINNGTASNSTSPSSSWLKTVPISTWYIGALSGVFAVAALLHPLEFFSVFSFIWYLAALPAGYVFQTTFSVCNLTNQSWGTREVSAAGGEPNLWTIGKLSKKLHSSVLQFFNCCSCCRLEKELNNATDKEEPSAEVTPELEPDSRKGLESESEAVEEADGETEWKSTFDFLRNAVGLPDDLAKDVEKKLKKYGYDNESFIVLIDCRMLETLKLSSGCCDLIENARKKIPSTLVPSTIPNSVEDWLKGLHLKCYLPRFAKAGYVTTPAENGVRALLNLNETILKNELEVLKPGHVKKLLNGKSSIQRTDEQETQTYRVGLEVNNRSSRSLSEDGEEGEELTFWKRISEETLHADQFPKATNMQTEESLTHLRNNVVVVYVVINALWILATVLLDIHPVLKVEETNVLGLLFLIVYGIIIGVQFLTCLWHRFETMIHYLSRRPVQPKTVKKKPVGPSPDADAWQFVKWEVEGDQRRAVVSREPPS